MGRKQLRRAADRGLIPNKVADSRDKQELIASRAIPRLIKWQKEYTDLENEWLASINTDPAKARQLRVRLNTFEQAIDGHIEAYRIDVGPLNDGYHYVPNARMKLGRHLKLDRLDIATDRTSKVYEYRLKRKRAQVRKLHSRIEELKEEKSTSIDPDAFAAAEEEIKALYKRAGDIARSLHSY